jgi:hypothetical protein
MKIRNLILFCLFIFSFNLKAANQEFYLNSLGFALSSGDAKISLSPGFSYGFTNWLGLTANLSFESSSYLLTRVQKINAFLGPILQLGDNMENAYFLAIGGAYRTGGVYYDGTKLEPTSSTNGLILSSKGTAVNDPSGFGFGLFLGKRFQISGPISFRPSVGLYTTGSIQFVLNLFSFSYSF